MKNDKTKTIVVSVLGVVLLGVGAFQFMPKGSAPVATASETYSADEDKAEGKKLTPEEKKAEEERAKQEALIAVLGGGTGSARPVLDGRNLEPAARQQGGTAYGAAADRSTERECGEFAAPAIVGRWLGIPTALDGGRDSAV